MNTITKIVNNYSIDAIRILNGVSLLGIAISLIQDTQLMSRLLWSGPLPFLTFILCHLVIATHLAGGLAIALGFATQIAALAQIPVLGTLCMFVLSGSVPEHMWALNLAPLIFLSILGQIVIGPGELSLDRLSGLEARSKHESLDNSAKAYLCPENKNKTTDEDEVERARRLAA